MNSCWKKYYFNTKINRPALFKLHRCEFSHWLLEHTSLRTVLTDHSNRWYNAATKKFNPVDTQQGLLSADTMAQAAGLPLWYSAQSRQRHPDRSGCRCRYCNNGSSNASCDRLWRVVIFYRLASVIQLFIRPRKLFSALASFFVYCSLPPSLIYSPATQCLELSSSSGHYYYKLTFLSNRSSLVVVVVFVSRLLCSTFANVDALLVTSMNGRICSSVPFRRPSTAFESLWLYRITGHPPMSHIACRQKIVLTATIATWTMICAIMVAAFRMFTVRVVVASSNFKPDNELSEYTVPFRLSFVSRSAFDLNPTFLVGSKKSNKCTALIADGLGTPQDELLRSDSRSLPPFEYWSKLTVTMFLLENILGRICIYICGIHTCVSAKTPDDEQTMDVALPFLGSL